MLVDKTTIARALRRARFRAGFSQVALAKQLGVTQGTISRAERGDGDIRLGTLLEVARALDLDLVVISREQRALIDRLTSDRPSGRSAIYTGMGQEPYIDDDPDESARPGADDADEDVARIADSAAALPRRRRARENAARRETDV